MIVKKLSTPLDLGKELQVGKDSPTGAGAVTYQLSLDAEAVLISLFVVSTGGDVNVKVLTEGADGQDVEVITFPTITAPSTDLLLKKSASVLRLIRVVVEYTGTCSYEVRARGVSAGASSVTIEGSSNWTVTRTSSTSTAAILIAAALTDRRGILVENISDVSGSTGLLWVGETLAKATAGAGHPIRSGGNYAIDLQAGAEVYAVTDGGTVVVSIIEAGGS